MSTNQIVENLKREIENFSAQIKIEKVGKVVEVFDGIAKVSDSPRSSLPKWFRFRGAKWVWLSI